MWYEETYERYVTYSQQAVRDLCKSSPTESDVLDFVW